MRVPTRQPRGDRISELGVAHRTKEKGREGDAGIWTEGEIRRAEAVRTGRQRGHQRVIPGPYVLIAELEGVLVDDLSQVFLGRKILSNFLRRGETAVVLPEEAGTAGAIRLIITVLEIGKGEGTHVGNP